MSCPLRALDEWSRALPAESDLVLASEARDAVLRQRRELDGVAPPPAVERHRGAAFLGRFAEALRDWVECFESAA